MGKEHHWVGVASRLDRQHVNHLGHRKFSYTETRAKREAAERGLDAYKCGVCGKWHLGKLRPEGKDR